MESFTSRLASFSQALPPTKKRPSDPKGKRALRWPHKNPAPSQLALAGFYYNPSSSCPDNVTCFLCNSSLDGWEETDDPVDEHLSHRGQCGWAIIASIEQASERNNRESDDPRSERMIEARRMTFAIGWPHENKRGWLCKIEKMVDAGWHHAPTQESDDFVKCAYCSLSLDGWEPKDNPYQEHLRRSPDCLFFKAVAPTTSKKTRSRKDRVSKASRLSTQSNLTILSDNPSFVDAEVGGDESMMSTAPAPSTKAKRSTRKASKRSKSSDQKHHSTSTKDHTTMDAYLEPEDDDFSVKVDQSPESLPPSKKRPSDHVSKETEVNESEADAVVEPSRKRLRTRARSSVISNQEQSKTIMSPTEEASAIEAEALSSKAAPMKGKKVTKKRATSRSQRTSALSNASKASLRVAAANDVELDAALELDLERPLTDDEMDPSATTTSVPKSRRLTRANPGRKVPTASVAPTRRTTRASTMTGADSEMTFNRTNLDEGLVETNESSPKVTSPSGEAFLKSRETKDGIQTSKQNQAKTDIDASQHENAVQSQTRTQLYAEASEEETKPSNTRTRQAARKKSTRTTQELAIPIRQERPMDRESLLRDESAVDDSGHETDASTATQSRKSKKRPATKVKKNVQRSQPRYQNIEDVVRPQDTKDLATADIGAAQVEEEVDLPKTAANNKSKKPAKPSKKAIKQKEAVKPATTRATDSHPATKASQQDVRVSVASDDHATPAGSPHSSDVENQPPSSMPSSARPPLTGFSPPLSRGTRLPLTASTPVRSPSKNTFSKLHSTMPWTALDLEMIFSGSPAEDKENLAFAFGGDADGCNLTSPEKKMTVEQWIQFNAQRGEEKLRVECERLVGKFEGEGMRALRTLEGIECTD